MARLPPRAFWGDAMAAVSIATRPLPAHALTQKYAREGAYTDCFETVLPRAVTQAEYVEAFYTTWVFKLERWILRWAVARPSTDAEARELAHGRLERFAAWGVEGRAENQLLMRDEISRRTCSWLMTEALPSGGTRLYFGSAVVSEADGRMGRKFSVLLGFHRLYSWVLLAAAVRGLGRA
jgi:hypothetical protein